MKNETNEEIRREASEIDATGGFFSPQEYEDFLMNKARQQGRDESRNETINEFLIELESMRRGVGQRNISSSEIIGMRYAIDLLILMFKKRIKKEAMKV